MSDTKKPERMTYTNGPDAYPSDATLRALGIRADALTGEELGRAANVEPKATDKR